MDFQGNLDKTYTVAYRFDFKPARPREADAWPKSIEENQERLKDAGEVVTRGLDKCTNCSELGHAAKHCPQEKQERERVVIRCFNCNEEGHRIRDCILTLPPRYFHLLTDFLRPGASSRPLCMQELWQVWPQGC